MRRSKRVYTREAKINVYEENITRNEDEREIVV
jgi:hypothetical protein